MNQPHMIQKVLLKQWQQKVSFLQNFTSTHNKQASKREKTRKIKQSKLLDKVVSSRSVC